MSFSAYPTYKDSGAVWLGSIPEHWGVSKIGFRARLQGGFAFSTDAFTTSGVPVVKMNSLKRGALDLSDAVYVDADSCDQRFSLQIGDILFGMSGSIGSTGSLGNYAVVSETDVPAMLNQRVGRFVLNAEALCADFLKYFLCSRHFNEQVLLQVTGTAQFNISSEQVESCFSAFPPRSEQANIARFLDHETARIDALIEEQQRLIELLKEKRQAVISHAVTKGLDPTVPMKDSGVEWLGEVPAHWELTAVKYVVKDMSQGWSPQCDNYPAEDGEWGVLKVGCVNGGMFNPAENKRLPDEFEPDAGLAIKQGDLLISRANTRALVGSAAVAVSDYPWLMLCDKLYRLRLNAERVAPEFLALYLGSSAPRSQIELAASGASDSMQNISQSVVMDMSLTLPPLSEQKVILQCLGDTLKISDELVAEVINQRCLLQERRSALISAAVTGKIDVRGWQPPAPTQAPKLEVAEAV